jgi:hypothetical protein
MSQYFNSIGKFPDLKNNITDKQTDLGLYVVKNHRDKPLSSQPELNYYEYSIQAGADITDERVASILDNKGDNISGKNKQYCEMTAAYWVWKNTSHEWKGIEHYRRHLLVTPDMLSDETDAVLPLPYLCYPNALAQFKRFTNDNVLNALMNALKRLHSDEYDKYLSILNEKYQYTYNLVCAKRNVFDAYCMWFFNITQYMETLGVPEIAGTRALSYVAEVLTNLYFMSNQNDLIIRHVGKRIFV